MAAPDLETRAADPGPAPRPKSGAAVSWPASMIERRTARVRVNRSKRLRRLAVPAFIAACTMVSS